MDCDPITILHQFFPYGLLAIAIVSLWITVEKKVPLILFGFSLTLALITKKIGGFGAIGVLGFGYLCHILSNAKLSYGQKVLVKWSIATLSAVLMLHLFPGFANLKAVDGIKLDQDTIPYSLYLNFDKTSVGFFLLLLIPLSRTKKEWKKVLTTGVVLGTIAIATLMLLSYLFQYVHFSLKLPHFSLLYLLSNLLSTCVAEEAFFRGFLLEQLSKGLNVREPRKLALLITSIIFGLAHFPGGVVYVLIATIAGLFYGASYLFTKRIEAAILTHFLVNTAHFFFFSFPALAESI